LIIVNGFIHDVADFVKIHPGGEKVLRIHLGTDATKSFTGEVYFHSNAAHNLLSMFRVGILKQKQE